MWSRMATKAYSTTETILNIWPIHVEPLTYESAPKSSTPCVPAEIYYIDLIDLFFKAHLHYFIYSFINS